jgi:hypothetical protein
MGERLCKLNLERRFIGTQFGSALAVDQRSATIIGVCEEARYCRVRVCRIGVKRQRAFEQLTRGIQPAQFELGASEPPAIPGVLRVALECALVVPRRAFDVALRFVDRTCGAVQRRVIAETQQCPLDGFAGSVAFLTRDQPFHQPQPVARLVGRQLHGGGVVFNRRRISLLTDQFCQFVAPGALVRFAFHRFLEDLTRLGGTPLPEQQTRLGMAVIGVVGRQLDCARIRATCSIDQSHLLTDFAHLRMPGGDIGLQGQCVDQCGARFLEPSAGGVERRQHLMMRADRGIEPNGALRSGNRTFTPTGSSIRQTECGSGRRVIGAQFDSLFEGFDCCVRLI